MIFKEKTEFEEFVRNTDAEDEKIKKEWFDRSFYAQMMDIWGEADRLRNYKIDYDRAKTKEAYNRMEKQGELFHHLCNTIYLNPKSSVGQKWELKCAEWELYDFVFWDNEWNNSAETVTSWFDQWCYDINYDILSA